MGSQGPLSSHTLALSRGRKGGLERELKKERERWRDGR